jgi:hypothetical protein
MKFDPEIALDYARMISRPRQVGTREEKKIVQEIAAQLEQSGYLVDFQPFQFSTALERFLSAEILVGMIFILTTILTYGISQWLTVLLIGLLIILILMIGPLNNNVQKNSFEPEDKQQPNWWSAMCWKLGTRYQTKNIVATPPGSSPDPAIPHLFLVAHYDSKSQYLPLVIRIALFVILIAGSLIFAALTLLSFFNEIFTSISFVIGYLVILSGIPLLFLDYGNDSPGAIDDASGVGLLLHLAGVIAKHPNLSEKLGITVLITSAEELAVKGALAYVTEHGTRLHNQAEGGGLHVLNFDGIGVDGKIYLVGGSNRVAGPSGGNLFNLIKRSAEELGILVGRFILPGALFDHVPFANEGFDALSVIGIGKSSWVVHSGNDSPEKLHVDGFNQAGRLAIRVIEKFSRLAI